MNKVTTFFLILLTTHVFSQTVIPGGNIGGTWDTQNGPYMIEGDLVVNDNERLAIEAGVQIIFTGPYTIEVYGRLDASGTENDSITFTVNDSTGFSSGNYNGWNGIAFLGPSSQEDNSYLKYCNIEFSAYSGVTCLNYSNLEISHSTIKNNLSSGINLMDFSDIEIHDVMITGNGTAGIAANSSAPQVNDFVVSDNRSSGIMISGNPYGTLDPIFFNGEVKGNYSNQNGGGFYISTDGTVQIENVNIKENTAVQGGGIWAGSASLNITGSEISFNSAQKGGGIYNGLFSSLTIDRVLISGNQAQLDGGGMYVSDAETYINHMTMTGNTSSASTGGIFFDLMTSATNTIENSILYQNYPEETGTFYYEPEITYSDVRGGYNGEGNIDADPRFGDPATFVYRLSWPWYPADSYRKSPCIDAGNPESDNDPDGTRADMGYEYFHHPENITGDGPAVAASVYPNPAGNILFIHPEEKLKEATVYNLSGHEVMRLDVRQLNSGVNVSGLHSGLFVIKMVDETGNTVTEKLIKK